MANCSSPKAMATLTSNDAHRSWPTNAVRTAGRLCRAVPVGVGDLADRLADHAPQGSAAAALGDSGALAGVEYLCNQYSVHDPVRGQPPRLGAVSHGAAHGCAWAGAGGSGIDCGGGRGHGAGLATELLGRDWAGALYAGDTGRPG